MADGQTKKDSSWLDRGLSITAMPIHCHCIAIMLLLEHSGYVHCTERLSLRVWLDATVAKQLYCEVRDHGDFRDS